MRYARSLAFVAVALTSSSAVAGGREDCRQVLAAMRTLHAELQTFEKSDTFRSYGFGAGGPHADWLDKAQKLSRDSAGKPFVGYTEGDHVVLPGDLIGWGLAKVRCTPQIGDCDLDYIRWFDVEIQKMRCKR